jgi:hypothetical protein
MALLVGRLDQKMLCSRWSIDRRTQVLAQAHRSQPNFRDCVMVRIRSYGWSVECSM